MLNMKMALLILAMVSCNAYAGVKLYSIDCGAAYIDDFKAFSDEGYFDGKKVDVIAPCFLISHAKGYLMWDTGVGENKDFGFLRLATKPVSPELKKMGISTKDIDFLAFSHLHIDHIGQANLFTESTWIMNPTEWKNIKNDLGEKNFVSYYPKAKKQLINGDFDVFGDGTVQILSVPGHTTGHQALLLKLDKSGLVLLSGDAYHQRESRSEKLVPQFNVDRANSLASMDRLEGIIKYKKAKLIIQHDIRDFKSLPKFPRFLD
jgi:N-acyl homoserine lactone hydrolase